VARGGSVAAQVAVNAASLANAATLAIAVIAAVPAIPAMTTRPRDSAVPRRGLVPAALGCNRLQPHASLLAGKKQLLAASRCQALRRMLQKTTMSRGQACDKQGSLPKGCRRAIVVFHFSPTSSLVNSVKH